MCSKFLFGNFQRLFWLSKIHFRCSTAAYQYELQKPVIFWKNLLNYCRKLSVQYLLIGCFMVKVHLFSFIVDLPKLNWVTAVSLFSRSVTNHLIGRWVIGICHSAGDHSEQNRLLWWWCTNWPYINWTLTPFGYNHFKLKYKKKIF